MRFEITLNAVLQVVAFAGAVATEAPDLMTKSLAILSGVSIGAMVAAVLPRRKRQVITNKQRLGRFAASFGTGAVASVIALWIFPDRIGIDPREWIFVVSALCAFFGWRVAEKMDERGDEYAAGFIDAAANRLKVHRKHEDGKARLVLLVLLGAVVLWMYVFWDVFVLLWLLMTTQVH